VADALPGVDQGRDSRWESVDAAVAALGRGPVLPLALVVDEAQELAGSAAGDALAELAARLPPDVHLILSARNRPATDRLGHLHGGRMLALEQAVRAARGARTRAGGGARSGEAAVVAGLRAATELYRGDLLAEIGTPEWVLEPRDRYRLLAAEAHRLLAERLLADDRAEEAAGVAERGLAVDRYCDGLWRLMIEAHDRGANQAAGAQARRSYRQVLVELGVGS
jgi:hypothetical protein